MRITKVDATVHSIPITIPFLPGEHHHNVLVSRVETDQGLVGWGIGNPSQLTVDAICNQIGPFLIGKDPMNTELIWDQLWWRFNQRAQTGLIMGAIGSIDIALWDIRGKYLNQPVWRLLGGFQNRVPAYITFGLDEYDDDQLVDAAKHWVSKGADKLKTVVALRKRIWPRVEPDNPRTFRGYQDVGVDVTRVRKIREAVGDGIELLADANCLYDFESARRFARLVEDYDISWLEEPIYGNDPQQLRRLRSETRIPIAAGQSEGSRYRFKEWIINESLDILQPHVISSGGYTEAVKVAHMAHAFNLPIANGGGSPHHHLHLQAAVPNGTRVEFHLLAWLAGDALYQNAPTHDHGWVTAPETPGLGLEPREEVLRDTLVNGSR